MRYVGRPVMQSCIEDMADVSEVQYQAEVGKIARVGERWEISAVSGEAFGDFDAVLGVQSHGARQSLRQRPLQHQARRSRRGASNPLRARSYPFFPRRSGNW